MDMTVKLDTFHGPLDLLYHLIEKNKINIFDIPIAHITKQYFEYVNNMKNNDMDSISHFLLMGATLLEIKSKMLLPKKEEVIEEIEDPREELVNKLIEYKKAKEFAKILKDKELITTYTKEPDTDLINIFNHRIIDVSEVLEDITLNNLLVIFNDVLKRKENTRDRVRSEFKKIEKDNFTILDRQKHIRAILKERPKLYFTDIFNDTSSKGQVIVTFLAILELIKTKEITVLQENNFADILIERLIND